MCFVCDCVCVFYICMRVRKLACKYAHMYVCLYVRIYVRMYVRTCVSACLLACNVSPIHANILQITKIRRNRQSLRSNYYRKVGLEQKHPTPREERAAENLL